MVEARGIEPLSENLLTQLSPGAEYLLSFPVKPPVFRLPYAVAFSCMTVTKAKSRFTFAADLTPGQSRSPLRADEAA